MDERPLNILLIEDNPGDAFLVKFYLDESSFRNAKLKHVELLNDGIAALSQENFDIILLDLGLPDSQGLDGLQSVLDASDNGIVIVMTGLTDESIGVETVKLGAQDFLVKGKFDGKVLASCIRYAFERYNLQEETRRYYAQLDESKQQLEYAQELIHFGFWELFPDGEKMVWKPYLQKILQVENNEAPTLEQLLALIGESDADKIGEQARAALKEPSPFEIEFEFRDIEGRYVCAATPVKDESGRLQKLVGIIRKRLPQ